jgi:hypothetical protein
MTFAVALLAFAVAFLAIAVGEPPVLSVCEVLQRLSACRGKVVVVVARAGWTFEGTFAHERCAPDDHIFIQGHRWLSMLQVRGPDHKGQMPVEDAILRAKLQHLRTLAEADGDYGAWVAMYGRIESPPRLKPHRPPVGWKGRNRPGNGYGANGSVPARITVLA